jgi:hypothetical protein
MGSELIDQQHKGRDQELVADVRQAPDITKRLQHGIFP